MAKVKRHKRPQPTVPVAVLAGFAPFAMHLVQGYREAGFAGVANNAVLDTTGYYPLENRFDWKWPVAKFYGPVLAGMLAHRVAGMVGINRTLARAGVPFLRV